MVEIEINSTKQILKLLDNNEFSYSLKIQDIASITAIQSNVSTSFSIPVFNDYETLQINYNTNKPYTYISCSLRIDGVYIFQAGVMTIEEVNDDNFLITVYEGNIDFISQIDGLTFADLDLSALNHEWQYNQVIASFSNTYTNGYIYPLIQYGAQAGGNFTDIRTEYLHPALFCKYILDKIFDLTTFTPSGTAYTDSLFESSIIPFSTSYRYSRWKRNQSGGVNVGAFTTVIDGGTTYYKATFATDSEPIGFRDNVGLGFLFDTTTSLYGSARIENNSGVAGTFAIYKLSPDGTVTALATNNVPSMSDTTYSISAIDVNFLAGDRVFLGYLISGGLNAALNNWYDYEFRFGYNYISEQTPQEIELKDFVKAIFAQYGIISEVNNFTNELILHKFEELGDNKTASKDWSNKLDFEQNFKLEYHAKDYAQLNYFAYEERENVSDDISRQSFSISDATLDSSKDWITLKFGACEETTLFNNTCIVIDKYIAEADNATDFRATFDTKVRLAYIETQNENSTFTDGIDTFTSSPPSRIAARFNDMQFNNLLTTYYSDFTSVFNKYKKITAFFRLSQLDIKELDFFTPIFLNVGLGGKMFLNGYFYINRVNNYQANESTEVELIRINI